MVGLSRHTTNYQQLPTQSFKGPNDVDLVSNESQSVILPGVPSVLGLPSLLDLLLLQASEISILFHYAVNSPKLSFPKVVKTSRKGSHLMSGYNESLPSLTARTL